jgi:hypothetical protein
MSQCLLVAWFVDFACLQFDMLVDETIARALLTCGIVAGPLYMIIGAIEVLTRPGFDVRYNMLSQMSLGDQVGFGSSTSS